MFKAGFSWLETCLASFEVSDANALRYSSFMLLLHHIIAIITNLLSKVKAVQTNATCCINQVVEFVDVPVLIAYCSLFLFMCLGVFSR